MVNFVTLPKDITRFQIYKATVNELTNTHLDLSEIVFVANNGASGMTGSESDLSSFKNVSDIVTSGFCHGVN
jgi:hypothetical protein